MCEHIRDPIAIKKTCNPPIYSHLFFIFVTGQ